MICRNCGKVLTTDALFCSNCGTKVKIESNVEQTPASAPYTAPVAPTVPEQGFVSDAQTHQPQNTTPVYSVPTAPYYNENTVQKDKSSYSVVSLISGILGVLPFCCCLNIIPAVIALVFGILGRKSSKSSMSIAGIVLGGIGIFIGIVMLVLVVVAMLSEDGDIQYGMYF